MAKFPKQNMELMKLPLSQCPYCHNKMNRHNATEEHIIPTDSNGSDVLENKIYACATCNNRLKHNTFISPNFVAGKTTEDEFKKIYIPDVEIRKQYVAEIRRVLLVSLNSDLEVE